MPKAGQQSQHGPRVHPSVEFLAMLRMPNDAKEWLRVTGVPIIPDLCVKLDRIQGKPQQLSDVSKLNLPLANGLLLAYDDDWSFVVDYCGKGDVWLVVHANANLRFVNKGLMQFGICLDGYARYCESFARHASNVSKIQQSFGKFVKGITATDPEALVREDNWWVSIVDEIAAEAGVTWSRSTPPDGSA